MAETETSASRDRDVDNFSRDETETRRWYVSRPRRRDRDHNPAITTYNKSNYAMNLVINTKSQI